MSSAAELSSGWLCPLCQNQPGVRDDRLCALALDAEMVMLHSDESALARISVVSCRYEVLLDLHVAIDADRIKDFVTQVSGIEPHHLLPENGALPFDVVQTRVRELLEGPHRIVGHALENDFSALRLPIPSAMRLRDTARCQLLCPKRPLKLKLLAQQRLGLADFQTSSHSSVDDARVALRLYHQYYDLWESLLDLDPAAPLPFTSSRPLSVATSIPALVPNVSSSSFSPPSVVAPVLIPRASPALGISTVVQSFEPVQETLLDYAAHLSLQEILRPFNKSHFVEHVPHKFESVIQYVDTFRPMLRETVRASCDSSLRQIALSDEVTRFWISTHIRQRKDMSSLMHCWDSNVTKVQAQSQWLPSSLVLIVNDREEMMQWLRTCFLNESISTPAPAHDFGIVKNEIRSKYVPHANESEWESQHGVFLQILGESVLSGKQKYQVLVIASVVTEMRADDALTNMLSQENEFRLAKRLMDPAPHFRKLEPGASMTTGCLNFDQKLAQYCQMQNLNSSQSQALLSSLSFSDPKWLNLIRGPPGTGKTTTICTLLNVLACTNTPSTFTTQGSGLDNIKPESRQRVLCCAPTNVAVQEIARKMISNFFRVEYLSSGFPRYLPHQQFSSLLNSCDSDPLTLDQLVFVGVSKNIEPFGLEFENFIDKDEDEESAEDGSDDRLEDDAFAPPVLQSNTLLSRIFLDHRIRRLTLLFQLVRELTVISLQICHATERNMEIFEKFARVFEKCTKVLSYTVHDFPARGPFVQFSKRCWSMRHEPTSLESGRIQFYSLVDEFLNKASTFFQSDQIVNGEADQISQLRIGVFAALSSLNPILDAWQTCLSDFEWSSIVMLSETRIFFSTVSCAARSSISIAEEYLAEANLNPISCVVMDEAAQLAEAYFSIVLLPSVQRVFLIGDEKQLPAIMLSNDLNHRRFGRSLFERFARGNWPTQMLLEQYRMHPEIALFPNLAFYQSKLLDSAYVMARDEPSWMKPPSSSSSSTSSPPNLFSRHMTLVNIKGFDGEQADALKSLYNKMEEDCVMALLRGLMRMMKQHRQQGAKITQPVSVAIIAPYRRQVLNFQSRIDMWDESDSELLNVEVATVDAFQGQERDIVMMSLVRSNDRGAIGFVASPQRLNVVMTRARYCLAIFGDFATFSQNELFAQLLQHAQQSGCFLEGHEFDDLKELLSLQKLQVHALTKQIEAPQVTIVPQRAPDLEKISRSEVGAKISIVSDGKVASKSVSEVLMPSSEYFSSTASDVIPINSSIVAEELDAVETSVGFQTRVLENLPFQLQISDQVRMTILSMKEASQRQKLVNILLKLGHGQFNKESLRRRLIEQHKQTISGLSLEESQRISGIIQDQQERQWSVLWMIEVHRSSQFSKQVVKILSTTTSNSAHEKQKIKTQMSKLLTERSDGYLERCRLDLNVETHQAKTWSKAYDKEVNFQWKRPKFSPVAVMAESTIDDVSADVSDHLANNLSLMKFFKLTSTYTRLLTNPLESNYESPFVLGPEEEDMVDSSVSQIILGRSGTGKTTVQLNRVFRLEVSAFELFSESSSDRAADELSMQHLSQDIISRLQNGGKLHQIMFTQSEQLCRTFNSVFKRMLKAANLSTHAYFGGQNDQSSLAHDNLQGLDFNDEVEQSIPNDFRQLTDHHFPLFVTAKKLMLMFDGSTDRPFFVHDDDENAEPQSVFLPNTSTVSYRVAGTHNIDQMVNFFYFDRFLWPRFDQSNKKNVTSAIAWTEFQATIRAGPIPLPRAEYTALNRKSNVNQKLREQIYSLFEQYVVLKQEQSLFDICDALQHIHVQLQVKQASFLPIDYIYCDEVQDLLPAQISLLKYLNVDPKQSFVLAGDTAQAISAGVSFRFAELKDVFYHEFCHTDKSLVPKLSYLLKNYRSHSGVLDLANTVVELIQNFFPNRIDPLPSEQAPTLGSTPMVIIRSSQSSSSTSVNILGIDELGAEQVLLVRDNEEKERLRKTVKLGLILTVVEAKGLEFRDVLLYNFFSNASPQTQQSFRLIFQYMQDKLDVPLSPTQVPPTFDETKHEELNLELKLLYVALTRARFNIFMFEEPSDSKHEHPMLQLWKHLSVISTIEGDDADEFVRLSVSKKSSEAEYRVKAKYLFDNEKFDEAAMFFEKAQDIPSAMLSRAHSMLTLGRFHALEVQSKLPRLAHSDHEVALAHAVLKQNSEPSKAAYRAYHQAAEIFHQLQQFNMSAKAYKACGMFEEAIECLRAVRQYLPAFRLSFELKPLRTSLLIDIGTQGSLYRQLLESFFTHKLLFDNIDHCCQWIAELRDKHNEEDSKFCDAWLMASVSLLLDAQESGHHSNISHSISKLLKLSNPSVVQHTIDQLERDNNHKVAMLIREKIDSTGSAQRYRSTGHLFKASSVLATMLNENRPVEAADRPLKDELIESILVPIRVGFLLPLLVAYKPFLQHHVEFVSHSICQAREACPSDVHSLELDVVESLFQSFLSREKHLALQGDQRNSFGMENAVQLQGLLSAMSKQSKKSSHSNVIRLQTIILSELLNQLPLCWSVKGAKRLPAEFTNIDDWYQHCAVQYLDLLNNYQRSVALVKNNGNENEPYFQAVEKSFASFPGDSIYFRKLLLCNLDGRNSTVSDKVLLKLVNQKHNSDSTPIVFDPKQWDKLISVRSTKLMDVYVSFVRDLFLEASHRIETDTLDRFGSTLSSFGLYTGNKQFKLNDRHRSNLLSTLNLLCTVFQNGSSVALREFSKRIGWFVSLTRSFQVTSDSFDLQVPRLSEPFPLYAVHSNVILWQLLYNRAQHISKLETSPHISLNSMVEHFMLLKLLWPESSISSVNGLAAFSVLKNRVPEHVKHRREELEAQKKSLAAKAEKSKDDEGRLQKLEHQLKAMKATEASSQWFADLAYMLFQALQSQQNLVQSALAVKLFSVVDVKLAFDMKRLVNKNRFSQNVLLDSIMAGSQAVHDFYHQMIVSNFCAASITFDNVPHSACLSFPLFINLVSHLVVSLIYVYQRANCIVLPKSLIAEVMLQPWSKAYFEWLNISIAQSNSDHQLQYLETLESLLVILSDIVLHSEYRLKKFCTQFCAKKDSPETAFHLSALAHLHVRCHALILSIGLISNSSKHWPCALRSIHPDFAVPNQYQEQDNNTIANNGFAADSDLPVITDLRKIPKLEQYGVLHFPKTMPSSRWIQNITVHPSDLLFLKYEEGTLPMVKSAFERHGDPFTLLTGEHALVDDRIKILGLETFSMLHEGHFSLASVFSEPAKYPKFTYDESNKLWGFYFDDSFDEATMDKLRLVHDVGRIGFQLNWIRVAILSWLQLARSTLQSDLSEVDLIRRNIAATIRRLNRKGHYKWLPTYRDSFLNRVPKLLVKILSFQDSTERFRDRQRKRKSQSSDEKSDSTTDSEVEAPTQATVNISLEQFQQLSASSSSSSSSDPFHLDLATNILDRLRQAAALLSPEHAHHNPKVQNEQHFDEFMLVISRVIKDADQLRKLPDYGTGDIDHDVDEDESQNVNASDVQHEQALEVLPPLDVNFFNDLSYSSWCAKFKILRSALSMPTEDQVHASLLSLLQASESNSAAAIILAENLNALLKSESKYALNQASISTVETSLATLLKSKFEENLCKVLANQKDIISLAVNMTRLIASLFLKSIGFTNKSALLELADATSLHFKAELTESTAFALIQIMFVLCTSLAPLSGTHASTFDRLYSRIQTYIGDEFRPVPFNTSVIAKALPEISRSKLWKPIWSVLTAFERIDFVKIEKSKLKEKGKKADTKILMDEIRALVEDDAVLIEQSLKKGYQELESSIKSASAAAQQQKAEEQAKVELEEKKRQAEEQVRVQAEIRASKLEEERARAEEKKRRIEEQRRFDEEARRAREEEKKRREDEQKRIQAEAKLKRAEEQKQKAEERAQALARAQAEEKLRAEEAIKAVQRRKEEEQAQAEAKARAAAIAQAETGLLSRLRSAQVNEFSDFGTFDFGDQFSNALAEKFLEGLLPAVTYSDESAKAHDMKRRAQIAHFASENLKSNQSTCFSRCFFNLLHAVCQQYLKPASLQLAPNHEKLFRFHCVEFACHLYKHNVFDFHKMFHIVMPFVSRLAQLFPIDSDDFLCVSECYILLFDGLEKWTSLFFQENLPSVETGQGDLCCAFRLFWFNANQSTDERIQNLHHKLIKRLELLNLVTNDPFCAHVDARIIDQYIAANIQLTTSNMGFMGGESCSVTSKAFLQYQVDQVMKLPSQWIVEKPSRSNQNVANPASSGSDQTAAVPSDSSQVAQSNADGSDSTPTISKAKQKRMKRKEQAASAAAAVEVKTTEVAPDPSFQLTESESCFLRCIQTMRVDGTPKMGIATPGQIFSKLGSDVVRFGTNFDSPLAQQFVEALIPKYDKSIENRQTGQLTAGRVLLAQFLMKNFMSSLQATSFGEKLFESMQGIINSPAQLESQQLRSDCLEFFFNLYACKVVKFDHIFCVFMPFMARLIKAVKPNAADFMSACNYYLGFMDSFSNSKKNFIEKTGTSNENYRLELKGALAELTTICKRGGTEFSKMFDSIQDRLFTERGYIPAKDPYHPQATSQVKEHHISELASDILAVSVKKRGYSDFKEFMDNVRVSKQPHIKLFESLEPEATKIATEIFERERRELASATCIPARWLEDKPIRDIMILNADTVQGAQAVIVGQSPPPASGNQHAIPEKLSDSELSFLHYIRTMHLQSSTKSSDVAKFNQLMKELNKKIGGHFQTQVIEAMIPVPDETEPPEKQKGLASLRAVFAHNIMKVLNSEQAKCFQTELSKVVQNYCKLSDPSFQSLRTMFKISALTYDQTFDIFKPFMARLVKASTPPLPDDFRVACHFNVAFRRIFLMSKLEFTEIYCPQEEPARRRAELKGALAEIPILCSRSAELVPIYKGMLKELQELGIDALHDPFDPRVSKEAKKYFLECLERDILDDLIGQCGYSDVDSFMLQVEYGSDAFAQMHATLVPCAKQMAKENYRFEKAEFAEFKRMPAQWLKVVPAIEVANPSSVLSVVLACPPKPISEPALVVSLQEVKPAIIASQQSEQQTLSKHASSSNSNAQSVQQSQTREVAAAEVSGSDMKNTPKAGKTTSMPSNSTESSSKQVVASTSASSSANKNESSALSDSETRFLDCVRTMRLPKTPPKSFANAQNIMSVLNAKNSNCFGADCSNQFSSLFLDALFSNVKFEDRELIHEKAGFAQFIMKQFMLPSQADCFLRILVGAVRKAVNVNMHSYLRWNGIRLVLKLFCNYVLSLHETFAIFMPFMALVVKAKEPHFVDFEAACNYYYTFRHIFLMSDVEFTLIYKVENYVRLELKGAFGELKRICERGDHEFVEIYDSILYEMERRGDVPSANPFNSSATEQVKAIHLKKLENDLLETILEQNGIKNSQSFLQSARAGIEPHASKLLDFQLEAKRTAESRYRQDKQALLSASKFPTRWFNDAESDKEFELYYQSIAKTATPAAAAQSNDTAVPVVPAASATPANAVKNKQSGQNAKSKPVSSHQPASAQSAAATDVCDKNRRSNQNANWKVAEVPSHPAQPAAAVPANYKRMLCKYHFKGACAAGDQCTYAHDLNELRRDAVVPNTKTKRGICQYHQRGHCKKGDDCPYLHEPR